ncbi:MAG: TRAP transporter large permease [Betaproteobacteria bacterium]|nr:TRAP transporter large permease [Betaproteobacteria bacterium]
MDPFAIAFLVLSGMFVLIFLHVPIGVAMGASGVIGFGVLAGFKPALTLLAGETATLFSSLDMGAIPLFLMMGAFATVAGLSEDLYRIAYALLGHRRGGLAMATIGGCAGFGAVCGSAVATAATFGKVALPQMLARRYSPSFAAGTIAAGGTLGSLVPPSIIMVVYAMLSGQLIITLYIAAIVPALLAVAMHFLTISLYVRLEPGAGPAGPKLSWRERAAELKHGGPVLLLVAAVLGGTTFGVFTATEAAAVGAAMAFFFSVARRRLTRKRFWGALTDTAQSTAMIYVIIAGASVFSYFVTVSHASELMVKAIQNSGMPALGVITALLAMYILLGAVFDEIAAMVITMPFVLPIIAGYGYDLVWWGVINVVVCELGMIVPPIGINVFVIHGLARQIPLTTIYRGVTPFILMDTLRLALLVAFPVLTLWLPAALK